PAFNWDNGYPGKPVAGTLNPNFLTGGGMVSISPQTLQPGITNQWNGGVELELTGNTRLSLNTLPPAEPTCTTEPCSRIPRRTAPSAPSSRAVTNGTGSGTRVRPRRPAF